MLRGHRSTFKPTSGSCQIRNNAPLGVTQSIGLGASADAGFSADDNFGEIQLINTISVPSNASIIRIYMSADGSPAACIEYSDPCEGGGTVTCPADSECCPTPCTTGLCCTKETGQCENGICQEDCDGCWLVFDAGASQAEIDEQCKFCGNAACCDCVNQCICEEGPLCFGEDQGSNCDPVPDCNSCDTEPPTGGFKCVSGDCDNPGAVDECGCVADNSKFPEYENLLLCLQGCEEEPKTRYTCCPGDGCKQFGEGELDCLGGTPFCTERACEECCEEGVTNFSRSTTAYASSVIPAFSTNKKNAGDNLSATQKSILDRGKPTLTTATAITSATAKAYNARLLHANLLDVTGAKVQTTRREVIVENTGSCDVCKERTPSPSKNVNCGSAIPSMVILEYDVGQVCSDVIKLQFQLLNITNTAGGLDLICILQGQVPVISGNNPFRTLLVDVVQSGYVIPNGNEGTIDCDSDDCGITFDCTGTTIVNGKYPTITSSIEGDDADAYTIPEEQPAFLLNGGKLQHTRPSSHTLEEIDFSITTTVLGIGSEKEVYTSPADADRIPTITGGPANHSDGGNSNITTKLVFDLDAIAAETAGNTYISVLDTNTLQHHYGVPGMGDCAIAGEYATSGEALFAAVFSDTPQEVESV